MPTDPAAPAPATATSTIGEVRYALDETFARFDALFTRPAAGLQRRPDYPDAWTDAEHLEHVALVNHFLLLTISKGVATALRRALTQPVPTAASDLARLAPIADPAAFPWEPPGHMLPSGTARLTEVKELLAGQHLQCLELLTRLGQGEGVLCSFRMSVAGLGRLDMYQWLYFLAQHGRWHLAFLAQRGSAAIDE